MIAIPLGWLRYNRQTPDTNVQTPVTGKDARQPAGKMPALRWLTQGGALPRRPIIPDAGMGRYCHCIAGMCVSGPEIRAAYPGVRETLNAAILWAARQPCDLSARKTSLKLGNSPFAVRA